MAQTAPSGSFSRCGSKGTRNRTSPSNKVSEAAWTAFGLLHLFGGSRTGANAALLPLRAEDNMQCALHLAEPPRIEGESDFDQAICRPVDFKKKPRRGELH
jgi:hypothetical protein